MQHTNYCPECGPSSVSHFFAKSNQVIGMTVGILTFPIEPLARLIWRGFYGQVDILSYALLQTLAFFYLIDLRSEPSVESDTDRAKCMWHAAKERGINVREVWVLGKPINMFLAKTGSGRRLVFEGLPRPTGFFRSLEWMDNKDTMKKKFHAAGFPVPRGAACFSLFAGKIVFRDIRRTGNAVVVKPTLGSRSRHTRIHVKTEKDFIEAFKIAKQICPIVSVEEELRGSVFRVTLIGGRLAGVLRRDPPFVVGDGTRTIRELVAEANRDPRRGGVFHAIPFDDEMDEALAVQNLKRDSVPRLRQRVLVGTKVGRGQGGTNSDVTDEVNADNRNLFLDIAQYLKDPLVGIDFIVEDISKSWRGQMPCGAIELNSIPFLDLHMYPFEGKGRDLSGMLWDEVLRS